MASGNEKMCFVLEHYFRILKLDVNKAKVQLDQLMELVVGKAMPLKFLPQNEFAEYYPQTKKFVLEVLSAMKLVNEQIEAVVKRHSSETSPLLQKLEAEKLLHPRDFADVSQASANYQESPSKSPRSSVTVDERSVLPLYDIRSSVTVDERSVLPLYDINGTDFTQSSEVTIISSHPAPSDFISTQLGVGGIRSECFVTEYSSNICSLISSVQAPIPSIIPMSSYIPYSTMLHPLSHGNGLPLPVYSTLGESHIFNEGPTVEVYTEAHGIENASPVYMEISQCTSEGIAAGHNLQGDNVDRVQEYREGSNDNETYGPEMYANRIAPVLKDMDSRNPSPVPMPVLELRDGDLEVLPSHDNMLMPDDLCSEVSSRENESSWIENNVKMRNLHITLEHDYFKPKCYSDDAQMYCKVTIDDRDVSSSSAETASYVESPGVRKKCANDNGISHDLTSVESHKNADCNIKRTEQCIDEIEKQSSNDTTNESTCSGYGNESAKNMGVTSNEKSESAKNISVTSPENSCKSLDLWENIVLHEPVNVYLSYFRPPSSLWVQLADCKILELQGDLCNCLKKERVMLKDLSIGKLVAARYKVDGFFYRGLVTEYLDGAMEANVLFIDYGNLEVVNKADISMLPEHLEKIPGMAKLCSLTHYDGMEMKTVKDDVRSAILSKIKSNIINTDNVKVIFERVHEEEGSNKMFVASCSRYSIHVLSGKRELEKKLDIADKPQEPKESQPLQTTRKRKTKTAIKLDLSTSGMKTGSDRKSDEVHWTPLSDDEMHRYGHSIPQSNLPVWSSLAKRSISSPFYTVDADGHISKSLKRPHQGISDTQVSDTQVSSNSSGNACDTPVVMSEGSEDSETIVPSYALPEVQIKKATISINVCSTIPVILTHVENPHLFYVRIIDSENASLEQFQKSLFDFYKANFDLIKAKELPVGSFWAVHDEGGSWNRAMVLANKLRSPGKKRRSPEVEVRYIDFGHKATVPIRRVRALHENFSVMQMLAFPCSLSGVLPVAECSENLWPKSSIEAFIKKCGGLNSTLFADFCKPTLDDIHKVTVTNFDGQSVNQYLIESGFAKSCSGRLEDDDVTMQIGDSISHH